MSEPASMPCWVYRCGKKAEMYLYLSEKDGFAAVPPALMKLTGCLELVMELQLHPGRALARSDVGQVMAQLRAQGFYLQMPPSVIPGATQ